MNPTSTRYYTYIKPILRNPVVKTYSPVVFSLITVTLFIIFAIKPTISTIISLQKSINEKQQILKQLEEKENSLTVGKSNYQRLSPKVREQLRTQIPSAISIPCLITNLRTLAALNEASISGLQFQPTLLEGKSDCPPQEEDLRNLNKNISLGEIDITFNTLGSYSQLTKFLNSLNQSNRLISIQNVNFNKQQEAGLIMSINAKAYYIKKK